jgi:hypothetical protein
VAPKQPGTPRDFRPPHSARANVVPGSEPTLYFGACGAGDWIATVRRPSQEQARADVGEHLADVAAHPHRPRVRMSTLFLGMCDAGDFVAAEPRESWAEAEADVAEHVAEKHPPRDER